MALMTGVGVSGSAHSFYTFNAAGSVWNGTAFVAWADADYASYRIAATEIGTTGEFTATLPADAERWQMRFDGASLAASYLASIGFAAASQASVDELAGDVEALQSSVTALSGTELSSVSPVGTDGAVRVYRARDYDNDDGLALEWSNSAGTWPDLTGATIHVRLGMPGCSTTALYQFTGSAPTPSGANQTVRLELTDADLSIRPDDYTYNVVATLASGNVVQLYTGSWSVLFALEAPAA